jgi:hypothetical protein
VDAFTKFAHAVPIKSKDASECTKALKETIENMGTFKTFFTDGEPAFESKSFIRILNKYKNTTSFPEHPMAWQKEQ